MRLPRVLAVLVFTSVGSASLHAQTPGPAWQLADEATLRARLATYVAEQRAAPGVVVGVLDLRPDTPVGARGPRFYAQGTSGRRGVALDADTKFELGSITKGFTGLLLADAVERGEVRLDATLGSRLPGAGFPPEVASLTLEELATHRSGLPRISLRPGDLLTLFSADPYAGTTPAGVLAAAALSPGRSPRGEFSYSNLGFAVLGAALASPDEDYAALLTRRVLGPLGLHGMVLSPDAAPPDRLARGFRPNFWPAAHWHVDGYAPAGALVGSARDLLVFFQSVLEHPSPAWALATTPRHPLSASDQQHIGLGWFIEGSDRGPLIWHNGGTGGFRTFAGVLPEQRLAIVVLANCSEADVDGLALSLLTPARPAPAAPPFPWAGLAACIGGLIAAPVPVWLRRRSGRRVAREPDRLDSFALVAAAGLVLAVTARFGAWQWVPIALWWVALAITAAGAVRRVAQEWRRRPWLSGSAWSRTFRLTQVASFLLLGLLFI